MRIRLSRTLRSICAVGLIACLSVISSSAWSGTLDTPYIPKQIRAGGVGVKLGVINTGLIIAGSRRLDPAPSISFGVFFNVPLVSRLMITPAFDLYNIHVYSLQEFMADFSVAVKPVFYRKFSRMAIRPSLAVGLGHMSTWDVIEYATTYLSIKTNLELAFFSTSRTAWLFEIGYTAFPIGGNSEINVRIHPSLTVRVGIEL